MLGRGDCDLGLSHITQQFGETRKGQNGGPLSNIIVGIVVSITRSLKLCVISSSLISIEELLSSIENSHLSAEVPFKLNL